MFRRHCIPQFAVGRPIHGVTPVRQYQAEWLEYVGELENLVTGNIHTLLIQNLITV